MSISRKTVCVIFVILAAAAALISIVALSSRYAEIEKLSKTNTFSTIDERLEGAFVSVNDFPGSAGKDILFLKTLARPDDLRHFLEGNDVYAELYLFDARNRCALRLVRDAALASPALCAAVSEHIQEALDRAQTLEAGAVYISPLLMHDGAPSLIYATGRHDGYVISVVSADYFLEDIRRLTRDDESIFLLLPSGEYLAHPDPAREGLSGGKGNFYRDFPDAPGGVLDDSGVHRFESASRIFTFWRIYPSTSNFSMYEGSKAIYGEEHAKGYFWIMAAVSEKPNARSWWQESFYLMTVGLIVVLHMSLVALAYYMAMRSKTSDNE